MSYHDDDSDDLYDAPPPPRQQPSRRASLDTAAFSGSAAHTPSLHRSSASWSAAPRPPSRSKSYRADDSTTDSGSDSEDDDYESSSDAIDYLDSPYRQEGDLDAEERALHKRPMVTMHSQPKSKRSSSSRRTRRDEAPSQGDAAYSSLGGGAAPAATKKSTTPTNASYAVKAGSEKGSYASSGAYVDSSSDISADSVDKSPGVKPYDDGLRTTSKNSKNSKTGTSKHKPKKGGAGSGEKKTYVEVEHKKRVCGLGIRALYGLIVAVIALIAIVVIAVYFATNGSTDTTEEQSANSTALSAAGDYESASYDLSASRGSYMSSGYGMSSDAPGASGSSMLTGYSSDGAASASGSGSSSAYEWSNSQAAVTLSADTSATGQTLEPAVTLTNAEPSTDSAATGSPGDTLTAGGGETTGTGLVTLTGDGDGDSNANTYTNETGAQAVTIQTYPLSGSGFETHMTMNSGDGGDDMIKTGATGPGTTALNTLSYNSGGFYTQDDGGYTSQQQQPTTTALNTLSYNSAGYYTQDSSQQQQGSGYTRQSYDTMPQPTTSAFSNGNGNGAGAGAGAAAGGVYTGRATWFESDQHTSQCGTSFTDEDLVVALGGDMYGANGTVSPYCGQSISITNTANGASVTCVISDNCPACTGAAALDLSKAAFSQLGALDTGVLQVQWSFPDATGQQQGQTQAQAQGAVGGDDAQKQGQQQQAAQPYGASQMASYGQAQAQGQAQDPAYVDGATGGSQMYGDTGTAVPTLYVRRRRL